jgi:hypothetical protein
MSDATCRPSCQKFGQHAYDCPNHTRAPRPQHCKTCTCPKEYR